MCWAVLNAVSVPEPGPVEGRPVGSRDGLGPHSFRKANIRSRQEVSGCPIEASKKTG